MPKTGLHQEHLVLERIGGQFGTGPNLAPYPIWHRTQFGTGPIWHQECKRVNLAPESIWHRSQSGTIQMEHISLLWTWYNTNSDKSPKTWKKQYHPQNLAIKVQYWKSFTLPWARKGPQTQKQTVPSSNVGNKSPVLKRFPFTWARKGPQTQNKQYLP